MYLQWTCSWPTDGSSWSGRMVGWAPEEAPRQESVWTEGGHRTDGTVSEVKSEPTDPQDFRNRSLEFTSITKWTHFHTACCPTYIWINSLYSCICCRVDQWGNVTETMCEAAWKKRAINHVHRQQQLFSRHQIRAEASRSLRLLLWIEPVHVPADQRQFAVFFLFWRILCVISAESRTVLSLRRAVDVTP